MVLFSFFIFRHIASIFSLVLIASCSTPSCRKWEINKIITQTPCFNGVKLILEPDSDFSNLELEMVRNRSGIWFYINLLLLSAPPQQSDPHRTTITIYFEEQEPWIVHPYLLEGRQRLLLPGSVADTLIQALIEGQSFTIQIGRSSTAVIPDNFMKLYQQFIELPIEEIVPSGQSAERSRHWIDLEETLDQIKSWPLFSLTAPFTSSL